MSFWRHNLGLKLFSLALAMAIWFYVQRLTNEQRMIPDVPLGILTRPDMTVADASTSSVTLIVQGTHEEVRQLSANDFSAVIDLMRKDRAETLEVPLLTRNIRHQTGVRIVQIMPPTVRVTIEPVKSHAPAADATPPKPARD
jgi:hypothetical protein